MQTALTACLIAVTASHAFAQLIVPDDHATIQAAVDAAPAGGTVSVRPGTYAESVSVRKSLTLRGLGGVPTIAPPAGRHGVSFAGGKLVESEVIDVSVQGGNTGILARVGGFGVLNVVVTGAKRGIDVKAAEGASIDLATVTDTTSGAGITASAPAGNIRDCVVLRAKTRGIDSRNLSVIRATVTDSGKEGVVAIGANMNEIVDNTVSGSGSTGIRIVHKKLPLGPDVLGNEATGNGGYGIWYKGRDIQMDLAQLVADNTASGNTLGQIRYDGGGPPQIQ